MHLQSSRTTWACHRVEFSNGHNQATAESVVSTVLTPAPRVFPITHSAPSALPHLDQNILQSLSTLLTSLFSPACLPPALLAQLVVLPQSKAWRLHLDVLILSASGGNVLDLAIMAARSALASVRIPVTKAIGYDPDGGEGDGDDNAMVEQDQGISGLVKGGKAGKDAVDFELVEGEYDGFGARLGGWRDLPVGLTINMVSEGGLKGTDLLLEKVRASAVSSMRDLFFTSLLTFWSLLPPSLPLNIGLRRARRLIKCPTWTQQCSRRPHHQPSSSCASPQMATCVDCNSSAREKLKLDDCHRLSRCVSNVRETMNVKLSAVMRADG